ncbi:MAG: glycine cleavage system aminomethyltransferase GcvT [Dysgonamonadaceae bacterium]|nr:glycine cleavage system aminomethyltransferase GcvT [Dysgonamonadaceae bacterium]
MKKTPFTDLHYGLGARMHEFAGYDMPIEYSGIIEEHNTVVNGVGVFDVSHMGEFLVTGDRADVLVQRLTSNDISSLPVGKAQYTCFPNVSGGIVDDLLVYHLGPDRYMLVVNASNIAKDWEHCLSYNDVGAELEDVSGVTAQLAVQGPFARRTLQKLTDVDLSAIPYYSFVIGKMAGVEGVIISNTGYTGCGGFELYFRPGDAVRIWDAVFEAGDEFGIRPVGLGARDTLRLEAGFPLYGNELDDTTTPLEAGLGWVTKFVDGNDFVGRSVLEAQKIEGVRRRLIGFEMVGRGIARHGYSIVNGDGDTIGVVTSGSISPSTKKAIGLGYVSLCGDFAFGVDLGSKIYVRVRERDIEATIVRPPFGR